VTGAGNWLVIGPVVFALAISIWVLLVLQGARRRRRYGPVREQADRGEVTGGRFHGGPSQGNRRDQAPRRD
jgi:hypothetical protein